MFISQQFYPTYIADQIKFFIRSLKLDLDLRFPEVRKRKRFEAQIETGETISLEGIDELANIENSNGVISFFDWSDLVEWHESFSELNLKRLLHKVLNDALHRESTERAPIVDLSLRRLAEIDAILSKNMMGKNPSLSKALWNRWNLGILYAESRFLIQLLQKI